MAVAKSNHRKASPVKKIQSISWWTGLIKSTSLIPGIIRFAARSLENILFLADKANKESTEADSKILVLENKIHELQVQINELTNSKKQKLNHTSSLQSEGNELLKLLKRIKAKNCELANTQAHNSNFYNTNKLSSDTDDLQQVKTEKPMSKLPFTATDLMVYKHFILINYCLVHIE